MKKTTNRSARTLLAVLLCAALCLALASAAGAAGGGSYGGGGGNYYVFFDSNGGSGWMDYYYPDTQPWYAPDSEFTRPGCSFIGWGEEAEGPALYLPGDAVYSDGDMTLYAQWGNMSPAELAARYTPRVDDINSWNINATVDNETGVRYMTARLYWSEMQDVDNYVIALNLGSPDGPHVPSLATSFSKLDGSVSTSWNRSYATVAVPFVPEGEEQVVVDGAVNGVVDGDVVYATVCSSFDAGAAPGNPVFFVCDLPDVGPEEVDQVSWFEESGNGTVVFEDYVYTITLTEDTVLPEGGLTLGNYSYHIKMNTHTLTGTIHCGWSELFIEHLTSDGRVLAGYASNPQTLVFDGYGYFSFWAGGTVTVTLGDYARFGVDSDYMTATVTNGAYIEDQNVADWNYANANPLAIYEPRELTEEELTDYTPKNVTVTPQEDGLIVECDYEPEARVININVDVLLADGSSARVISDSSSSSKDQVMSLEGDRQPFFVGVRCLSDEEEQEISEDGEQKYANGFHGGDRLSVTMNFGIGAHMQETPWSDPPVTFTYSRSVLGTTFAQGNNTVVARNFLPEIAEIRVTSPLELPYNNAFQTLEYGVFLLADGTELELGVDYTEEYINNWMPGDATLAVIGLGTYSGRMTQPFTILGIDLGGEDVSAALVYDSTVYSGGSKTPAVIVTHEGRVMSESSEYYVAYSDNVDVGTATVTLTPGYNGVTTGTRTLEFAITPRSLESEALYVTLAQNRFAHTGEAIEPALTTVRWGATALTEGTDYTLRYEDNTDAGTAYAVLTGMGNYAGEARIPFTIYEPVSLATAASFEPVEPVVYTGAAQTPPIVVKVGDTVLTEGWDYTIAYSNNKNAGEATVTVTGRRDYTDVASTVFTIKPAELSQCTMTLSKAEWPYGEAVYTYSGNENQPSATVTFNGRQLYEGTSYTLSYVNNVDAGTATAIATGMGNFAGTLTADFSINPMAIDTVYSSIATPYYNGQAQTPELNLHHNLGNGTKYMVEGRDYEILGYANNVNAGTLNGYSYYDGSPIVTTDSTVTVRGLGNYSGEHDFAFGIAPMPVNTYRDFTLRYDKAAFYTGSPVNIHIQVKWKLDGSTLVEGRDYTVEYWGKDGEEGNRTDVYDSCSARITFCGNFSGSNSLIYFAIVEPLDNFTGVSGIYYDMVWSISADGTLYVDCSGCNGVLPALRWYNDVAWRPYRDYIKKIVVSSTVNLGNEAFDGCRFCTEIALPEGLTTIGYSSFTGCDSLQKINIPSTVTYLNGGTFPDVEGLEIHLPDNISKENLDGYPALDKAKLFVRRGSVTDTAICQTYAYFYYEDYPDWQLEYSQNDDQGLVCYKYVGSASDVRVPNFVDGLNNTFEGSYLVQRVVVPANVRTMGYGNQMPFEYCYGLRELVFEPGNRMTELRSYSFYGCNDLTVYIPDNITSIGSIIGNNSQNILIVANCNSYAIEWAKSQMSYGYPIWTDEAQTENQTGPRYRMIHNLVPHEGQAPLCEADGFAPYNTCSRCDYTNYTALPALGHDWGEPSYAGNETHDALTATRVCLRDDSHIQTETVDAASETVLEPTCLDMGETTYTPAPFENPAFTVESVTLTDIPALGHAWGEAVYEWSADHSAVTATHICQRDESHVETETVEATSAVTTPATCLEMGDTTYTSAEFENEAFAVQSVTLTDVPALGHAWGEPVYEWSAGHSAVTATRVCANDPSHVETETVEATADITLKATCEAMGETTYAAEGFRNPAFADQRLTLTDVPALGHAWAEPSYRWNADHSAVTAKRVCTNDPGHVETETATATGAVTLAPTCLDMGQTTYTTAEFENDAFAVQTVTLTDVPALGHDWGEPVYEWNAGHSAVTATRVCGRDESHVETETVEATADITLKATCEAMGETTYAAEGFRNPAFADQSLTLTDVPALGHDWGEPVYEWNADHSAVTATRVCANDPGHVETETAAATGTVTLAPTCLDRGETTYSSAAFENPAFEAQTVTLSDVLPLGHTWGEPVYEWNAGHSAVTAKRVCVNDANHVESETVNATGLVTLLPTCEAMGETTYTSDAFSYRPFAVQTVTLTDVPALGHAWGEPSYEWNADHSAVTATRVCANDESHVETETAEATGAVTTPATCLAMGETTYTSAAFENPAFAVQSVTLTDVPMLEHSWKHEPSTAAGEEDGVRGALVCERCGTEREAERAVSCRKVFRVPAMLKTIGEEAFCGVAAEQVTIPNGALRIGKRAFADCDRLLLVVIPASVNEIENDAFEDSDVAVICPADSFAARWCDAHHIPHNP